MVTPRGGQASDEVKIVEGTAPPGPRLFGPKTIVRPEKEAWASEYPFTSKWMGISSPAGTRWLHFIDEGPKDGTPVFFAHGNPTWSFYWRKLVSALTSVGYRCVAIDHLGMGLSDRPQNDPYRLADHVARACMLVRALGLKNFHVVGHDWGGCIGAGVAEEFVADVKSIVWMNTAAFRSQEIPLSIASCRIPGFGALAVRGFNGFAGVATYRAMAKHERMTPTLKAGLLAPYGNWHDRIATLKFVEDIPLKESHPSYAALLKIEQNLALLKDKPVALFWGDDDFCFTPNFRKRFETEFPNAQVNAWADCGHYVVEDAHEKIIPLLTTFFDEQKKQKQEAPASSSGAAA